MGQENYIVDNIMYQIKRLQIDCPECENMWSDDQYACGTCGGHGGGGNIDVYDWVVNHPEYFKKQE
jgi:ribosomal protein S27AE